jgi:acetyltransferase-like isoleucine patch superfamily enzyme
MDEASSDNGADVMIHPTAVVEENVTLQPGVQVWHFCHVRKDAVIEEGVVLGKGVFVDAGVVIGAHSRIQNGVSIYRGVSIAPWVLVGPHVVLTNDRYPRAGNRNWKISETKLGLGASLGAGAVLRCGIEIGPFALIGAGSVLTRDVPAFHLAVGLPARSTQMVCACGQTQLPLESPWEELLRNCCKENLDPDLCHRAETYLEERRKRPTSSL